MVKLIILLILIIVTSLFYFKDNINTFFDNNNDVAHIKSLNNNYKTIPENLKGHQFDGENLNIYEVTRERLLPQNEINLEETENKSVINSSIIKFYIQLASYKNYKIADEKINELKKSNDIFLNNLNYSITEAEIENKGIFYRLRIGPINNLNEVFEICKYFNFDKNSCVISEEK